LRASRQELTESLKEGTGIASSRRFGFREALVMSEVALTLILLVGAGLLINSLVRLISVKPGFASEHILTLDVSPPAMGRSVEQLENFYTQVLERLSAVPGMQSAAAVTQLPLGQLMLFGDFKIEGRSPSLREPYALKPLVSPDYFKALSIPLIKGRDFTDRDTSSSGRVAIISESLARSYFAGEEPIGKRVSVFNDGDGRPVWREVVGVVGDVRQADLATQGRPTLYAPYTQAQNLFLLGSMTFVLRSTGDPSSLSALAQREIQSVDKDLPVARIKTMRERVFDSVSGQRFNALLLGVFGTLALVLAAIGIFGVMSYAVAQRTREIGIRMALGAQPGDVVELVTREGMLPALMGVVTGLGGAFVLTRFISSMLFGIQRTDPLTFAGMALLLTTVALAACYLPARRAARVDPIVALRNE
jgi:predicted permease